MAFLPSRHYVSDFEQFLDKLKAERPGLDQRQREARAIWWDKNPSDLELRRDMDTGRVALKPYVYQSE
jgi:hypothetical protein